jgi:hypothetical protein
MEFSIMSANKRRIVREEVVPVERLIVQDNLWWPTGEHIEGIITNYAKAMREGSIFPPIQCAELDGELLVYDGVLRKRAYTEAGITDVRVQIITIEAFDDAMLLAVAAHPHEEDNRNEDDEDKRVEAIIDALPDDLPDHRLGPGKATWLNSTASMMKGCEYDEEGG